MIQQGGYGQIYGASGGGAGVGVGILDAAQANVNFARQIELQRLALQKRALRQQAAQMRAQQKERSRQQDLALLSLQLQERRLDMEDAQNQFRNDALVRSYEQQQARLARQDEMEERKFSLAQREADFREAQWQDKYDLEQSAQQLRADELQLRADALYSREAAQGAGDGQNPAPVQPNVKFDDAQKAQLDIVKTDLNLDEQRIARSRKALEELDHAIQLKESELEGIKKEKLRAPVQEQLAELRRKREELAGQEDSDSRQMRKDYQWEASQNPSLLSILDYQTLDRLPWEKYSAPQKSLLKELVRSGQPRQWELLAELGRDGQPFDYAAADAYRQAASAGYFPGVTARMFLSLPWDRLPEELATRGQSAFATGDTEAWRIFVRARNAFLKQDR